MLFKSLDLTTALRPSLSPDETLLFVQDEVGLYEGYDYFAPAPGIIQYILNNDSNFSLGSIRYQNINAAMPTSHRIESAMSTLTSLGRIRLLSS